MKFGNLGSQALLFTVLMALSHPAVAAPFTNGNFETPGGISFTGIGVGSGNTALLTGWTVGGPGGALQNADVFYQNSSFVGVMGISGDSSVGFGGNGSTGGTLSQTFDTVPGSNYTIDYFVTDQQGLGPQSFLVQALNGALVINSVTGSVAQTASFNWMAGPNSRLWLPARRPLFGSPIRVMELQHCLSIGRWMGSRSMAPAPVLSPNPPHGRCCFSASRALASWPIVGSQSEH